MYFSMFVLQDFPLFGNKFALLAGLLLLIISSQSFAIFFISISKSLRQALTLGSGFGAIGLAFSGITFPIFGMPVPMQWLSQLFPLTHFLELFFRPDSKGNSSLLFILRHYGIGGFKYAAVVAWLV